MKKRPGFAHFFKKMGKYLKRSYAVEIEIVAI